MKTWLKLFLTGIVQVYFVAVNTVFLSKELYLGVLFAAFMISMIWSWNVRKIVFGSILDRVCYSLGAATGSLLGLYSSAFLSDLISRI